MLISELISRKSGSKKKSYNGDSNRKRSSETGAESNGIRPREQPGQESQLDYQKSQQMSEMYIFTKLYNN